MPTDARKSGTIQIFTAMPSHAVHGDGSQGMSQGTMRGLDDFGLSCGSET